MASVFLDFVPPDRPDLIALHILESDAKDGVFNEIEEVTDIGTYGNYISSYSTDQALVADDWFAIQWEDSKGVLTDLSQPIQGGQTTAVGEIVRRAMQRDPTVDELVLVSVVEATLEQYFNVDPYTVDWNSLSYREREGLTLLSLAFTQITKSSLSGETTRYTAGLVSQETSQTSATTISRDLFNLAYRWLGINQSTIAQMAEIVVAAGARTQTVDQSRLLITEKL